MKEDQTIVEASNKYLFQGEHLLKVNLLWQHSMLQTLKHAVKRQTLLIWCPQRKATLLSSIYGNRILKTSLPLTCVLWPLNVFKTFQNLNSGSIFFNWFEKILNISCLLPPKRIRDLSPISYPQFFDAIKDTAYIHLFIPKRHVYLLALITGWWAFSSLLVMLAKLLFLNRTQSQSAPVKEHFLSLKDTK